MSGGVAWSQGLFSSAAFTRGILSGVFLVHLSERMQALAWRMGGAVWVWMTGGVDGEEQANVWMICGGTKSNVDVFFS